MLKQFVDHLDEREELLASAVKELASELRLIEVGDLVDFIRKRQFGTIAHIVASSAELYYKPGTLLFLNSGETTLDWGRDPGVALDLKFENDGVTVYFRLFLESSSAGIQIDYLFIDDQEPIGKSGAGTRRIREAIEDAKFCADSTNA
jgi:hypothetical protein